MVYEKTFNAVLPDWFVCCRVLRKDVPAGNNSGKRVPAFLPQTLNADGELEHGGKQY